MNRRHAARRVALGKIGQVIDTSLETVGERKRRAVAHTEEKGREAENLQSFDDLSDLVNEDFIYVL